MTESKCQGNCQGGLHIAQNRKAGWKRSIPLPLGKRIPVYFYLCLVIFCFETYFRKAGLPKCGGTSPVRRYQNSWGLVCPVGWVRVEDEQCTCAAIAALTLMRTHLCPHPAALLLSLGTQMCQEEKGKADLTKRGDL